MRGRGEQLGGWARVYVDVGGDVQGPDRRVSGGGCSIYMYICLCVCVCVCVCVYVCECVYVCIYTYIHTYYVLIDQPIPYITSSPLCLLRVFASKKLTSRVRTYYILHPRRCVRFVFLRPD